MFSKTGPGNKDYTVNSNSGQLLREIEAISNALFFQKLPREALLLPADIQFQSTCKTRLSEKKSNQEFLGEDVSHKERKASSIWNWKKPLKSLTHIGHKKFSCLFNLHVHSIDGLPTHFNDASLRVNWKRKDEISQTRPSKVCQGIAEFNETLIHKCSVYGGRSGPNSSAKYDPKIFLIYVSGVPELDIGKHWIDVTKLLPPTLEYLVGEKSSGRWTTSFKLSGKANGAVLHVSFVFLMMRDGLVKLGHFEVSKLLNLIQNKPNKAKITSGFRTTTTEMAPPVPSVSSSLNYGSVVSAHSVDEKIWLNPGLELSESIDFLYQKLDEGDLCGSPMSDSEFLKQLNLEPDAKFESEKETNRDSYDRTEFTVIDCGIEINNEKPCNFDEVADKAIDKKIECCTIHNIHSKYVDEAVNDENSLLAIESILDWLDSPSKRMSVTHSAGREPSCIVGKLLEQDNLTDKKASHHESKMLKKSASLDEVTESVVSDFLGMLGLECGSFRYSGCDPESPRELLLRQFEEETLVSCNSILYCDSPEESSSYGSRDSPVSRRYNYDGCFDFASSIRVREEHKNASHLRNRRKAQILENLETEALMQTWGINEKDFQYSPHNCPAGFGSPIELPLDDPLTLPPLAEGFGSFIQLKGGGFLRSMNPAFFKDSRNAGKLVIQLSRLVVLPAEMGSHFMEILQRLASIGADKLYMQVNKIMTLEDINGKTIPQLEAEAASCSVGYERKSLFQDKSLFNQESSGRKTEAQREYYVSPQELIHLAMDTIEVLSIEGLKIQSDMYNEEAASQISLYSNKKSSFIRGENSLVCEFLDSVNVQDDNNNNIEELMDLSITLEEWLKLDAGIIGNENHRHESILKILAAHHAKSVDIGRIFTKNLKIGEASSELVGLLGNNLTVALMLQVRDPLRNLEEVGRPMLCLIQVERTYGHRLDKRFDKDEENEVVFIKERGDEFKYKINKIHLLGVNSEPGKEDVWGTTAQHVSGSRWLVANGTSKTIKLQYSSEQKDVLWSISSSVDGKGSVWEELIFGSSPIRNPDVIFQN